MYPRRALFLLASLLLLSVCASACQPATTPEVTAEVVATIRPTTPPASPTPEASATPTPKASATPTSAPDSTVRLKLGDLCQDGVCGDYIYVVTDSPEAQESLQNIVDGPYQGHAEVYAMVSAKLGQLIRLDFLEGTPAVICNLEVGPDGSTIIIPEAQGGEPCDVVSAHAPRGYERVLEEYTYPAVEGVAVKQADLEQALELAGAELVP